VNYYSMLIKDVSDRGPGTWTSVISSGAVDTDGEVLLPGCFNPLPDKIPVCHDHGGPIIGSGRPYYKNSVLHVDGVFASTDRAQETRRLVVEGHLHQMSIIGRFKRWAHKGDVKQITEADLFGVDFVTHGANRDARVLAARSYDASRKATTAEIAMAKAQVQLVLAQAALTLSEPEPLGDHATFIRQNGAKAYAAAILKGRR
jgi:hypothetical protein